MGNHSNSFYDHRTSLATVALPQNALIVMATTTAITGGVGAGGSTGEEAGPGKSLSLTQSGQLLLSPTLPPPAAKPASPSPPSSASPAPTSLPPPPHPLQAPGVATLSLTLLPSPVIGGLLLTPSSSNTCSSVRSPPPAAAASLSSPSPPSSPSRTPLPSSLPPTFDPDSFLNSPKQGQTYGGPPPPSSSPCPALCSSSPLSHPSLALSLSPPSTPPSSVSPPSDLSSSFSDTDRRDSALPLSSSSSSPLSAPPPTLSLSPSSSVAPPLLPLCLELGPLEESSGVREEAMGVEEEVKEGGVHSADEDDDEGSGPPTKLALLQVRP